MLQRNLFVVSSEVDDAAAQVRSSISVYALQRGRPAQPSIVSAIRDAARSAGAP